MTKSVPLDTSSLWRGEGVPLDTSSLWRGEGPGDYWYFHVDLVPRTLKQYFLDYVALPARPLTRR